MNWQAGLAWGLLCVLGPACAKAAPPGPETLPPQLDPATWPLRDAAIAAQWAQLESGQSAALLASLDSPPEGETPSLAVTQSRSLLRALALDAQGRRAEAAEAYVALQTTLPLLTPRLACLAMAAFEGAGRHEAAAAQAGSCHLDPVKGRTAPVEAARLQALAGRRDEAVRSLDALVARSDAPVLAGEALVALARQHAVQGDLPGAVELARRLVVGDPGHPAADRAAQLVRELAGNQLVMPLDDDRLWTRAWGLLEAGRTAAAAEVAAALPIPPRPGGDAPIAACIAPVISTGPKPPGAAAEDPAPRDTTSVESAVDGEPLPPMPGCFVAEPVAPVASDEACRRTLLRATVDRRQKRFRPALDGARAAYAHCASAELRARAARMAGDWATALKDAQAPALWTISALQFPAAPGGDEALWSLARRWRDAGDPRRERAVLRLLLRHWPAATRTGDAVFALFWSYRADGRLAEGVEQLRRFVDDPHVQARVDAGDLERATYWWGRSLATAADPAQREPAVAALVRLAVERPMTYYGLLARSFLGTRPELPQPPLPPEPHADEGPLATASLSNDKAFVMGAELARLGHTKAASELLQAVDWAALRDAGAAGREGMVLAAELLRGVSDEKTAFEVAKRQLLRQLRDAADPLVRRASRVGYPLAFRPLIDGECTRNGYAPDFLQGLMREESALDPRALSPVGARGLTQLMPATAAAEARLIGASLAGVEQLWEPETNIRIGSSFLGRMLRRYGHMGLAAAAYNAGPGAVDRWLKGGDLPFDAFVEQIPFNETRNYVKRVLRSYATYRYLYGPRSDCAPVVSMALRGNAPAKPLSPAEAPTPLTPPPPAEVVVE